MDKVQVEDLPQEKNESPKTVVGSEPLEHMMIANRYNVDTPNKDESKKLMEIWEYGKNISKTKDSQDVIWQIMHLEGVLGAPKLGESKLDKVYRWVKLKKQESMIQEELKRV